MIKLNLLENIGLSLDALTTSEKEIVKIEKLLKAEKQFNDNISTDDIVHLINFLKSNWKNHKDLLINPNIKNLLFNTGKYEIKKYEIKVNNKEVNQFLDLHFYENISTKFSELIRDDRWTVLVDIKKQYPFLFQGKIQEFLHKKLSSHVEVILTHTRQKIAPSDYKKHFSLHEDFYVFLNQFDSSIFEPIEDNMMEILLMSLEGYGADFYNYLNELKKRLTGGSKEFKSSESEGCSERTWTIISYIFTFIVIVILYKILDWNNSFFWFHIISMFLISKVVPYNKHIEEESLKVENGEEIVLNKSYWKQRKFMFYFFLIFAMGFILSLPTYGYWLLSNKLFFLKPIGVIFIILMIWGVYLNAKDEKKNKDIDEKLNNNEKLK